MLGFGRSSLRVFDEARGSWAGAAFWAFGKVWRARRGLAQARQTLLESHVERPVQRVLYSPMAAAGLGLAWPRACAGGNGVARVEAAAILEFCPRIDLDDGAGVAEAQFSGKPAVAIEPVDLAHEGAMRVSMRPWPLSMSGATSMSSASAALKAASISACKVG